MKNKILIVLILILNSKAKAQLQVVTTNTVEHITYLSKIQNSVLISGLNNFGSLSDENCNILSTINKPTGFNPPTASNGEFIQLDSNNLYFFLPNWQNAYLYKTNNKGNNWNLIFHTDSFDVHSCTMFDSLNGIIVCSQGVILRTQDGWQTWQADTSINNFGKILGNYADSVLCVSIPSSSGIFYTSNKGINWSECSDLPYLAFSSNLFLLNDTTIFSVETGTLGGTFFSYSFNKNKSWINKNIDISPYGVTALSHAECYVVGFKNSYGTILKTTDTGNTWINYQTPYTGTLTRIIFLNDSIALISGTNGYLAKWNKNSFALSVLNEGNQMNNSISIHPNPTLNSQQIEIELVKDADLEINLISILGQKLKNIHHQKQIKGNIKVNNDLTDLSNGIYFYEIAIDNKKQYIKTIKD